MLTNPLGAGEEEDFLVFGGGGRKGGRAQKAIPLRERDYDSLSCVA